MARRLPATLLGLYLTAAIVGRLLEAVGAAVPMTAGPRRPGSARSAGCFLGVIGDRFTAALVAKTCG